MSANKDHQIEDYLLNRLNDKDRMDFENALQQDEGLKKELELQALIIKGARSNGRDQLKNRLQKIHQQEFPPQAQTRRLWPLLSKIAAVALLLIICGVYFFKGESPSAQQLFAQNYEAYSLSLASRDVASDKSLARLNELYRQKNYKAALPLFDQALQNDSLNARMLIGAGICHLELNQPQAARNRFSAIIEAQDLRLQDMARWYTALSFLKEGQIKNAQTYLDQILSNPKADQYKEARQLSTELKKLVN